MPGSARKYRVELTAEEREELEALLRKQSVGAAKQRRARILLLSDCSHLDGRRSDAKIAELVGLSERQVVRIRQKFVRHRDTRPVMQACDRQPRPLAPERRRLDGKAEAQLVTLACSTPSIDRDHWTLQMLCDELVRLEIVESICPETVRKCLKKTNFSRGGSNATASRKQTEPGSCPKWRKSSMSIRQNMTRSTS